MTMGKTCRCCLTGDGEENIFQKMEVGDGLRITYSDMLTAITSNKVLSSDSLPHQICHNCSSELKQAYKFRIKCDRTYETWMLLNASHQTPLVLVNQITNNVSHNNDGELNEIFLDEDVIDNAENECKDVKVIKTELNVVNEVEDNGFMIIEPLDDFNEDQDDPGDVYDDANEDVVKPETETKVLKKEKKYSTNQSESSNNTCPVCAEKFKLKSSLKNHIEINHPEYKTDGFFCEICKKTYKNGRRHNRLRHRDENVRFDCSMCDEKFKTSQTLKTHLEEHKVDGFFKCKDCHMEFPLIGPYHRHMIIHKEKKYLCDICSKSFADKYGLTVHMRTHTKEKPFRCPICKKSFITVGLRNKHLKKHDNIENLDEETSAEYLEIKQQMRKGRKGTYKNECKECGKVFKSRVYLEEHMNRHFGLKPHYCELCNKHVASIRGHKYFHRIKNVDATCPICNKQFSTKTSMRTHMRIHTDVKPFKCDLCEASFTQAGSLKSHKRCHTNEKNYICHHCSKAFRCKRDLMIHIRSHTQDKPFACDLCPLKCVTAYILRIHKSRHEDVRLYPCKQCDKTFKTKSDARQHLRSHAKVRKHQCRLCDKVFYRTDHRSRHERTVHCMNLKSEEVNE